MLRACAAAFPDGRPAVANGFGELDALISDCAPILNTKGGFFSGFATSATGRQYFCKGIAAWSREARFWRLWRNGAVRAEGRHYRVLPPVALIEAGPIMLPVFPALDLLRTAHRKRKRNYARNLLDVARAAADFNSAHLAAAGFPAARGTRRLRVPRASAIRAVGIDEADARAMVSRLRTVEAGWQAVRSRADRLVTCLAHMDLGPGNIAMHEGRGVMIDFGHAGAAPVGADLHTVLRYAGPEAEVRDLLRAYAEVFAEKGVPLDVDAAEFSLRAHYAGRYRNLRLKTARDPAVFARALEMSERLLEGGRAG